MEEMKISSEEKDNICEKEENNNSPDLVEAVREKHWDDYTQKNERISDFFVMQLILCVLIVLIFAIINFFDSSVTGWYTDEFKKMSLREPEQIIKNTVKFVMDILK